jgi:MoaA/NifB/PqqE/SkfB family radical SAM enzyme
MYKGLLDILAEHPDCYFQVFTNGQLITPEHAARMREMGNVTPLISIEGTEIVSDQRRGRNDVYTKSMQGILNCVDAKLLTGVATSLCQTNIDDLLREEWLDKLIDLGVMYAWYHTYRPVGPEPNEQLCLTPEQQLKIRKFVVEMRAKKPIAMIDAYYMHDGQALCPASTGISHHISPWGAIEPCPIIQFAKENIRDERHIRDVFVQSEYLKDFRQMSAETTRGCIMLERPDKVKEFVEKHDAPDGTARGTALPELEAMNNRPSQWNRVEQVPEKNWIYKFAKKHFFSDFGAYENLKED